VLYHFGSREKLLREVAILAVGVFRSVLQSAQAETLPPRDRTAASVAALFTAENRTLMVCVHELMGLGMRDAEIGALMTRSLEETAVGPAKTLEKQHGLQALSVARSLIMAVQGHVELWLCAGSEADPKPYVEAATRTALAIAAPPTVR
jgi:AcrR family transcriptional regulator